MLRSTIPPRHSRVCSSTIETILTGPPVGGGVELEIHRPHPIGCIGDHGVRGGRGTVAFAASALRYPKSLFAPKALDFLVIHPPAFTTGVVIRRPEAPPGMILGVGARTSPATRRPGHQESMRRVRGGEWRGAARLTRQANRSLTPSTRWR